jgi:cell division protein FtsB
MQISEVINTLKDWARIYLAESNMFGAVVISFSILIVALLAFRYKKRRKKMKELKRQREIMTARLNKLVEGRDYKEIIKREKQTAL